MLLFSIFYFLPSRLWVFVSMPFSLSCFSPLSFLLISPLFFLLFFRLCSSFSAFLFFFFFFFFYFDFDFLALHILRLSHPVALDDPSGSMGELGGAFRCFLCLGLSVSLSVLRELQYSHSLPLIHFCFFLSVQRTEILLRAFPSFW